MQILAATDGSKYGQWAIEWIANLPLKTDRVVRVLHVIDVRRVRAPVLIQQMVIGIDRYLRSEVKKLETAARTTKKKADQLLTDLGLKGTIMVERGNIVGTIVKRAARWPVFVSIGSRGLDALDRFMLGSTSQQVLRQARCSVLVVKETPRPVRHILVAVDGSSASAKAVRFVARNIDPRIEDSQQGPVVVELVYVTSFRNHPGLRVAARAMVGHYAHRLAKQGYQVRESIETGKAADAIVSLAKREKVDLIVTGATGVSAVRRLLLGSVSTRVAERSECSVLVVR